jgi:hypothetical protein
LVFLIHTELRCTVNHTSDLIKLFYEYEEKYIHPCRRKKALPMHTVKASISPETEKKKMLSKQKVPF